VKLHGGVAGRREGGILAHTQPQTLEETDTFQYHSHVGESPRRESTARECFPRQFKYGLGVAKHGQKSLLTSVIANHFSVLIRVPSLAMSESNH
jgi:hypothetical protein